MYLNSYLSFNGQCEAAFKFYERCLGGKITMMLTSGDSPVDDQVPEELKGKIMHACIAIGNGVLMGADCSPNHPEQITGCSMSLGVEDPTEAERIFHALSENGTVRLPIQQTFWSARFGMLVDPFGVPWMINCVQPAQ